MKKKIYCINKEVTENVKTLQDLDSNSKRTAEFRLDFRKCTFLGWRGHRK